MHLGNSVICPVTGVPMLAMMGAAAFWAFKNAKKDFKKEQTLPFVAVTALVFALQMINFTIPTTGSSGHIIGTILLSALFGPYAAFLAISAILLTQALFFADGGLLALGCNIFNMGFIACFAAYPLVFKPLSDKNKPVLAAIFASIVALQLGSLAVVAESAISGSTSANIGLFADLMQAIHLPIGIVEGVISAGIIAFAQKSGLCADLKSNVSKNFTVAIATTALILAGIISAFASKKPDGLEWSLLNMSETFVAQTQGALYTIFEAIQAKTAVLIELPSSIANISGLFIISAFMFAISKTIATKGIALEK